jgi:hypothetical protein
LFSTAHVATTTPTRWPEAIFLGEGDLHDTSYDYMRLIQSSLRSCNITSPTPTGTAVRYPYLSFSNDDSYTSNTPPSTLCHCACLHLHCDGIVLYDISYRSVMTR